MHRCRCNTFNGPYASNSSSIVIGPLAATAMACAADIAAQETLYLQLLQSAANFQINGNTLILCNPSGQEILRFYRTG